MDVAAAALLLLMVAPAFVVVFLLVRADGGPGLVAHRRIGRAGREFGYLHFRIPEADTGLGPMLRRTALEGCRSC